VICDRFFDSTVAYQGGGRGIADPEWLLGFQETVTGGVVPDRTYYIRVPVDVARDRLAHRDSRGGADRMEIEDGAFFARVTETYDRIAEWAAERVRVIDGARDADAIAKAIWQDVEGLLPERN
jgi:dTMP kinase